MNVKSAFPLFLLAASVSLAGQSAPQPRIMAPIDDTRLVPLHGNVHPLAQARFDRGAAPLSMATGPLLLLLQRSTDQQQALTQYLSDAQNPRSPNYHQWLTPAQYSTRFGISDSDLQAVEIWLQSHALKVERVSPAHNVIQFSGTVGGVQDAFHTAIHSFQIHGLTRFANVTDPQIPAALASVVAGVSPLNSFHPTPNFVTGPRGRWDTTAHSIKPELTLEDGNSNFYLFVDPADAATIYDTPNRNLNPNYSGTTWDGTGVNIGIVGVSDLTIGDVQNYREAFLGETSGSLNLPVQVVDGNDPGLVPGAAADEALLDNEIAGGIAPKAKIYYYTAADTDLSSGLLSAVFRAIDDNTVSILSASFGECESALGTSGNRLLLEAAQQAAAQGISFVVSSGDNGSAGCDDFNTQSAAQLGFAVNGFASTPYTVAVGGTDFDALSASFSTYADQTSSGSAPYYRTALSYIPENPWNDSTKTNTTASNNVPYLDSQQNGNIVAGSGGVSSIYSKPSWQNSLTPVDNARDIPDVSLLAANGFYNAMWAFCGDSTSDGSTAGSAYTACQTSGGQFTTSTVFEGVGGTSAAAPAFAAMLALVSQSLGGARLGQPNPILYSLAVSHYSAVFHDVTAGNNSVPCGTGSPNCGSNGFLSGYNAGTGYDLASGLGSVDAAKLIQNWTSVSLASTSTTLNIGGSTASYTGVHGASLTFNVGVSSSGATPTGNVAILDSANETSGGTSSGPQNNGQFTIPLSSGSGTATYNGLPGGTYTVSAHYSGDASNASSTSSPISVTISREDSTTILRVNAYNTLTGAAMSGSTIPYGSALFTDAHIEGTAEGSSTQGLATGTVTFTNNGSTLGTATISSDNVASWPVGTAKPFIPPPGSYSMSASYTGDPSYNSSTSAAVAVTVAKALATLTLSNTPSRVFNLPANSYPVDLPLTIQTPYNLGAAPTGTVTATINGQPAGTVTNVAAVPYGSGASKLWYVNSFTSIPNNLFVSGPNAITVNYSGDANYAASSASATITDSDGLGTFTMASSGDLGLVAGLSASETVTLTPSSDFYGYVYLSLSGIPTGMYVSAPFPYSLTTVGLFGSAAVLNLQISTDFNLAPGTYPITVTGKDITGKTVQSATFNVVVTGIPANASFSLSNGGAVSIAANASTNNSATVTFTPANGFIGLVRFTCSVTTSMTNTFSPPTCQTFATQFTSSSPAPVSIPFATTKSTTSGTYTVNITATDTLNSAITASTTFSLTVTPWQGVYTSVDPSSLTVGAGAISGNTLTATLTPSGGYTGTVYLDCSLISAPANVSYRPQCNGNLLRSVNITGVSPVTMTLTINTSPLTDPGTYSFGVDLRDSSFMVDFGGTDFFVVVQPGPGLTISKSGDIIVKPGATTGNTATISVTPSNGFSGAVNLSCSVASAAPGAVDVPTCSLPSTVTITGNAAATATLTVNTTSPSASLERPLMRFFLEGGGAVLAMLFFFGIPARRRAWRALLTLLAVMMITSAMIACGGGGSGAGSGMGGGGQTSGGTTPGMYTITVKAADAASGMITASTNVAVTVN